MRSLVKRIVASPPVWRISRRTRHVSCAVLAYHRVGLPADPFPHLDAGVFRQQMRWLVRNCEIVTPDALSDALTGAPSRPRVLVTFDDGYRGYFLHAYPVLEELRVPAVNFLSTGHIDDGGPFWWDVLFTAAARTRRTSVTLPWTGAAASLRTEADRRAFLRACKDRLKSLADGSKQGEMKRLLEALDVHPHDLECERQVMSWSDVRAARALTTYGGHTHTHVIVSRVGDVRLDDEIRLCRDRIAQETGTTPAFFAYPNGDVTPRAREAVGRHGFTAAFTMEPGFNTSSTDRLALRRLAAPSSVAELAWILGGFAARARH